MVLVDTSIWIGLYRQKNSHYQLAAELLARFPRLGAGDAIIAATAINSNTPLLTFDKDYSVLEKEGLQLLHSF